MCLIVNFSLELNIPESTKSHKWDPRYIVIPTTRYEELSTVACQLSDKRKIINVTHSSPVHMELDDFHFFPDNQIFTNRITAVLVDTEQQLLEGW